MTRAFRRALSANRLLAACGSLLTVTSEVPKGACRAFRGRDRRKRRTHPRIEDSGTARGCGGNRLRPREAFVIGA